MNTDIAITTFVSKDRDGWGANSKIKLDDHGLPGRILEVSTYKWSGGGVWTHAQCSKIEGGFKTFVIYGDFTKTIQRNTKARCTQKTVETMHEVALADIEALLAECVAFYVKKEAA